MTDSPNPAGPPDPEQGPQSHQVRAQHLSARVPEEVSPGVFSTGVILMTGSTEFVIDFVQNLGPPPAVVARVIVPHAVMPQFIAALKTNIELYTNRFGPPPALPRSDQPQRQQTVQEIYDDLKLPDEKLSGSYANGLMIGHTASEFKLDFLTNLFPHSAVSCRVFMSAPQVSRMLETMSHNYQQFQARVQQQQQQRQQGEQGEPGEPPPPPPPDPGPEDDQDPAG